MSDDLTTDLAYFLDQIINGATVGLVWTSNGPGILPTWQPGGGGGASLPIDLTTDVSGDLPYANLTPASAASRLLGRGSAGGAGNWQEVTLGGNLTMTGTVLDASAGGATLPITAAANDVVLQDSGLNPLIALDAAEVLTLAPFNVGTGGFAQSGTIRWPKNATIIGRDGPDTTDVQVLALYGNGTRVQVGGLVLYALLQAANPGGNEVAAFEASLTGTPSVGIVVTDSAGNSNAFNIQGPADLNAFYPELGTPHIGLATKPWKGIFTGVTGRATAQVAAVGSVATDTVGVTDGSYLIAANILVTTATVHSFNCTCTYTDEGNTSRTVNMSFSTLAGAITPTIANAAGAVPYEGVPIRLRCKAGSTITVATSGTFTTVTYNVEVNITQVG